MCTAITFGNRHQLFGRNLDLEQTLGETVTITPRSFPFSFRNGRKFDKHYVFIGTAHVRDGYPLYYDAVNEKGLAIAGLAFDGNAKYTEATNAENELATFEVIPWFMSLCQTVAEVRDLFAELKISNASFDRTLKPAPLHWLIADKNECITVEPMKDGIKIFHNPVGVLTNNPPFDFQLLHLSQFLNLTSAEPTNRFSEELDITSYSKGMGAFGLPGDLSSASRFVRAAFVKWNSIYGSAEKDQLTQFFHVLSSVEQQSGCSRDKSNSCEMTHYTSCMDIEKGIYFYRTYENSQITAVALSDVCLEGEKLLTFPMVKEQQICWQKA